MQRRFRFPTVKKRGKRGRPVGPNPRIRHLSRGAFRAEHPCHVTLKVRRDDTRFDGRFLLPQVVEWMADSAGGAPLPPLSGTLVSPRLDVAGARMEGIQVEFGDGSQME